MQVIKFSYFAPAWAAPRYLIRRKLGAAKSSSREPLLLALLAVQGHDSSQEAAEANACFSRESSRKGVVVTC